MTCAVDGALHCKRLFPDALWIDYTDPGYSLCMKVRDEVGAYSDLHGHEPSVIFIGNHGVFVAGDRPDQIGGIYGEIFDCLEVEYHRAGMYTTLVEAVPPPQECITRYEALLRSARGEGSLHVAASGVFAPAEGPVSPDHIVYAGARPFRGEPSAEAFAEFNSRHGHDPKIVLFEDAVLGLGESRAAAGLALEVASDAALVVQLAWAFGGIRYMDEGSQRFIEGWEVEAYRRKQV
jgi:rhamnose utilization protein RhaD (predicted bifunctional aldolase and dehydrogenase)